MADYSELTAKQRRVALEQLSRDRLIDISDRCELDVGDKRVVANHVDAIVRSRRVDFGEVLGWLSREELKVICEALGLDSGGREKQALIDRIAGNATPVAESSRGEPRSASERPRGKAGDGRVPQGAGV